MSDTKTVMTANGPVLIDAIEYENWVHLEIDTPASEPESAAPQQSEPVVTTTVQAELFVTKVGRKYQIVSSVSDGKPVTDDNFDTEDAAWAAIIALQTPKTGE